MALSDETLAKIRSLKNNQVHTSNEVVEQHKRYTPNVISSLKPNEIFVFGSNTGGRHGAGAAKAALKFGAKYGVGEGIQGNTYAIPTKDDIDHELVKSSLQDVAKRVRRFIIYAKEHQDKTFLVTRIGLGLAGFKLMEIVPLFESAKRLQNVVLPKDFY